MCAFQGAKFYSCMSGTTLKESKVCIFGGQKIDRSIDINTIYWTASDREISLFEGVVVLRGPSFV